MPKLTPDNEYLSLFNIEDDRDWTLVLDDLRGYADSNVFWSEVKSYFENICKSIIIEKQYADKDYRDTYYNFYSKKFPAYNKNCRRVHFFRIPFSNKDEEWYEQLWQLEKTERESIDFGGFYIGNMIFRPVGLRCIGRTTIGYDRIDHSSYSICYADYEVNLLGSRFMVKAFPHISQDKNVSQCALASLWMVLRYYSQKYSVYKEILPFEVSQLIEDKTQGRIIPAHDGLWMYDLTEAIGCHGFFPLLYEKETFEKKDDPDKFLRLLYYYVESGIPMIVGFPKHAVAVFGHTEPDFVSEVRKADDFVMSGNEILNSSSFMTGLIINDDNHMPYQIIPKEGKKESEEIEKAVSKYTLEEIDSFVVPLYEKIYLPADRVEQSALTILNDDVLGFEKMSRFKIIEDDKVVLRIFLTSSRSYKRFRRSTPVSEGYVNQIYLLNPMPKFVWIAEISTLDRYKKRKIIGEIIFDATACYDDEYSFIDLCKSNAMIKAKKAAA